MATDTTLDVRQERKNSAALAELHFGFTPREAERLAFIKWLAGAEPVADCLRNPHKARSERVDLEVYDDDEQ